MRHEINTKSWKDFQIGKLFEISRPVARSKDDYRDGNVPSVASGTFNNGVLAFLQPHNGETLDKGNCLTVSPLDGSAFYQPNDFLGRGGAGSAIIILYNSHLSQMPGLYIATVLSVALKAHSYIDQISSESIKTMTVKLPVNTSGDPDWSYMSTYMSKILNEEREYAEALISSCDH